MSPHQQVNQICNLFSDAGITIRQQGVCTGCGKFALVNSLPGAGAEVRPSPGALGFPAGTPSPAGPTRPLAARTEHPEYPWYWEGNVQAALVTWLAAHGYAIRSVADTASRASGKDIVARTPGGNTIWISVKGFPEGSPNVQARHWFSGAVFDLILYREENRDADLAVAFPDGYPTYRNLAARCTWLREAMPFRIFWVALSGEVTEE